jgi:hypothetical protein
MDIRKVQTIGGESAGITLPKEKLKKLGIIENGALCERYARIEHVESEGSADKFTVEILE